MGKTVLCPDFPFPPHFRIGWRPTGDKGGSVKSVLVESCVVPTVTGIATMDLNRMFARKNPSLMVLLGGLMLVWTAPGLLAQSPTVTGVAEEFTLVEPYRSLDLDRLQDALDAVVEQDPDSVFLPGAGLGPMSRALLTFEGKEDGVGPARYRIRFGLKSFVPDQQSPAIELSMVQVDRFNLASAHRAELIASHGRANVRPESELNRMSHVSWRLVTRPLRGTTAMPVAASRAEIPEAFAGGMDCLGVACSSADLIDQADRRTWQEGEAPELGFEAVYRQLEQGVPTVATMLELLLADAGALQRNDGFRWTGFEPREGVPPGSAFVEVVIEVGLGQDARIVGVLRDDHLMDHETRTRWTRIRAVATSPDQPPVLELGRSFEHW